MVIILFTFNNMITYVSLKFSDVITGEFLSIVLTIINILLWSGVVFPQIYKNYKLKSCDALSYLLIIMLAMGSAFSILAAYLKESANSIIYNGLYNLLVCSILIVQYIYYRYYNNKTLSQFQKIITISSITVILVIYIFVSFNDKKQLVMVGDLIAWFSFLVHTFSRIPQIVLNWQKRSVFGLSKTAFRYIFVSNIFFISSIFVISIDLPLNVVLLNNIQWILSSFIGIFCDFIILYQFYLYENNIITISNDNPYTSIVEP
jgi:hypothetical protein